MTIENVRSRATTDNCRYCLMCRHVCPVGHVTCWRPSRRMAGGW